MGRCGREGLFVYAGVQRLSDWVAFFCAQSFAPCLQAEETARARGIFAVARVLVMHQTVRAAWVSEERLME